MNVLHNYTCTCALARIGNVLVYDYSSKRLCACASHLLHLVHALCDEQVLLLRTLRASVRGRHQVLEVCHLRLHYTQLLRQDLLPGGQRSHRHGRRHVHTATAVARVDDVTVGFVGAFHHLRHDTIFTVQSQRRNLLWQDYTNTTNQMGERLQLV